MVGSDLKRRSLLMGKNLQIVITWDDGKIEEVSTDILIGSKIHTNILETLEKGLNGAFLRFGNPFSLFYNLSKSRKVELKEI